MCPNMFQKKVTFQNSHQKLKSHQKPQGEVTILLYIYTVLYPCPCPTFHVKILGDFWEGGDPTNAVPCVLHKYLCESGPLSWCYDLNLPSFSRNDQCGKRLHVEMLLTSGLYLSLQDVIRALKSFIYVTLLDGKGLGEIGIVLDGVLCFGIPELQWLREYWYPSRVESSRVESSRVESSRVESSRVESSRVESSRAEPSRVESSNIRQRFESSHCQANVKSIHKVCLKFFHYSRINVELFLFLRFYM